MKLTPLLPLTLLLTPILASHPSDYQNAITCGQKNPSLNTAIDTFCNRRPPNNPDMAPSKLPNNIVVPSPYAKKGATSGKARVWIEGTCNPKQWVPLQYCGPQFHAMCARGLTRKRFGRKGCQRWRIEGLDEARVGGIVAGVAKGQGKKKGAENVVGAMKGG